MREALTPDRTANAIRLQRGYPGQSLTAFLIVEGSTDERFYKWLVNRERCKIHITYGKNNAMQVLSLLEQSNFLGMLAFVDADFDVLEGKIPFSQNLLFTDTHDLETMIIHSPALTKVLHQFGSADKIEEIEKDTNRNVIAILLESGTHLGYLRWVSLVYKLSLTFEGLDFGKFVSKEKLTIDVAKLIKAVKDKSQKPGLSEEDIRDKLKKLQNSEHSQWHICCGHDLVSILSLELTKAIGTYNTREVAPEMVEKFLYLAYERSYFAETQLYLSIQQWEQDNTPFIILGSE